MSQASPTIGPNKSGLLYRQEDNDGKLALLTHNKGASAPSYAAAGTVWIDDSATPWKMKFHDGADWITMADINPSTNTVSFYSGTAASRVLNHATDSGAANAYEVSPSPPAPSYATGQIVFLKPAHANTGGSATISVSGLSAKDIKMPNGANPPAGTMQPSGFYILVYDGTDFILTNAATTDVQLSPGITGYVLSNAADTANDITVSDGVCTNSTHVVTIRRTAPMTKQLDAAWAAGSNQGGRDTGGIADGTWHVFVISDSNGGNTDILFSQSASAPVLPDGFTYFRRVGSIIRSYGFILQFSGARERAGGQVVYGLATAILDVSTNALTNTGAFYTVTVPSGTSSMSILCHAAIMNNTTGTYVIFQHATGVFPSFGAPSASNVPGITLTIPVASQYAGTGILELMPNATPAIRMSASQMSTTVRLVTIGWVDARID